jgi:hypothetical protein
VADERPWNTIGIMGAEFEFSLFDYFWIALIVVTPAIAMVGRALLK